MAKRKPIVHDLKTWPEFFGKVKSGVKRFEVRRNDRDFQEGDFLDLMEWNPDTKMYTGRRIRAEVTYVLNTNMVADGFVVMSIKLPNEEPVSKAPFEGDLRMWGVTRTYTIVCPSCHGGGFIADPMPVSTVINIPCPACNGNRFVIVTETLIEPKS